MKKSKRGLLASMVSICSVSGIVGAPSVLAQEDTLEEVTVTASRLKQSGYEAPTPVTTLNSDDMELRGTTNIADIINELPGFTGSLTPTSTTVNSRQNGANALDLRGLGPNRNLVLVNGRRHVPFDEFGNVNINAIPSLAIDRLEVVTGGASAAWGSDAVSGVINVIYDKKLEGAKVNVQYGQSAEGDGEESRVALAFGTNFANDRGHLLLAMDYTDNKGIPESRDRGWQQRHTGLLANSADTGPNDGIPQFVIADNAALYIGSPNGVTIGLGLPTDNLEFLPNGTAIPRDVGIIGGNLMIGGSGSFLPDRSTTLIPQERQSFLLAADYQLTDSLDFFVEGSYSTSETLGALVDAFSFGLPLSPDNAYMPADVAATGAPVILFRTFEEFPPISSASENETMRVVFGFEGELKNNWTWDAYAQWGQSEFSNDQPNNLLVGNLAAAADAVLDPATGNIVCRANLGGANGAPGCAPINLFGKGSPSQAAIDYITETGRSDTEITQKVIAASIGGEIAKGWAGPIIASFGAEYREEELDRKVGPNNDNFAFSIVNAQPLQGKFDVTEAFAEFGVPLVENTLDLNAAVRWTDYSTIGSTASWKTGINWQIVESLRFRATISQDIRAPSIGENFLETLLLFGDITNPITGNEDFVSILNTGNLDLTEEESITTTFGLVYSHPQSNWQVSVDWYNIDIDDAIGNISSQEIVDGCAGGNEAFCDLVEFGPDNTVLEVTNKLLNLGTFEITGLDFATSYSTDVGPGVLGFNLLGSYVFEKLVAPAGGNPLDVAGEVGTASGFGMPELKFRLGVNYSINNWGIYGQARYVGEGKYNAAWGPEQLASDQNNIDEVIYVDLSARYAFDLKDNGEFEIYGGVNNVFDEDPPRVPLDFISNLGTNPAFYDVIGTYYNVGARWNF